MDVVDGFTIPPGVNDLEGIVWWCGDDWCDCTEAQIVGRRINDHGYRVPVTLWHGDFYTDSELGAEDDLQVMEQHLLLHHPELHRKIKWHLDGDDD